MRFILASLVLMAVVAGHPVAAVCADQVGSANPVVRYEFSTDNIYGLPVISNFSLAGLRLAALLDLGAEALVVNTETFEYLGLSVQHRAESVSATGARYSRPASVIAITAPGTRRSVIVDIVANDPLFKEDTPFECILPRTMVRTDRLVMLGSRNELYLYNEPCPGLPFAAQFDRRLPAIKAVSVWETGSGLLVPVIVDGEHLYFFKLDTGASVSSINAALVKGHPGYLKPAGGHDSVVVSSGLPTLRRRLEVVAGFHLQAHSGPLPLAGLVVQEDTSVPASLPAASASELWPNFMAPAGTLGMDFLGNYDLAIDFEQHVLLLWDPADTPGLFR